MRKLQFADLLEISDQAPPAARDILQSISTALVDGPLLLKNLRSKDLTKRADFKSAKSWLTRQINDQAQAIVESGSLNFKTLRRWAAARHLVEQLSLEVQIGRPKSHSVTFPDCEHPNTKHLIGIYSRHPTAGSVPTMLLDASGDAHLYSQIFSDMKIHNLEARRNANIYQVQRKSFSRQSILGVDAFGREIRPDEAEKLRQDIIQVIVGRLEVHEKILVVAQLAVTKFLEGPLQPYIDLGRIQLAHFNALRGLNSFESCTSAVIVGRVQPSPGAVEALARALYWDDPKPLVLGLNQYTRKTSTRRMADGSTQTEWIDQHPDPRVNAILQQLRERELEQAVDRLRLIYDIDPKDVFLLTNIPIEAEITATARWWQFHDPGGSRMGRAILQSVERVGTITVGAQDYEAVVLPFGRELNRCFPKIFPSLDSAKDCWDDGGGLNGGQTQIELLFGNTPHLIVTYRRPKQPGKPCRALVAIRPVATPHVPKNGADDPNPADSECASTAPNSDPYQNSQDNLQAAAKVALQRLIPEAKIISVEPAADTKSGR